MLRLCRVRAFMTLACLCTKRLSIGRSTELGFSISQFPAAVPAAGPPDGPAVSPDASSEEVVRFRTSDVPSRDSTMFGLSLKIYRTALRNKIDDYRAMAQEMNRYGDCAAFDRIRLPCRTCSAVKV